MRLSYMDPWRSWQNWQSLIKWTWWKWHVCKRLDRIKWVFDLAWSKKKWKHKQWKQELDLNDNLKIKTTWNKSSYIWQRNSRGNSRSLPIWQQRMDRKRSHHYFKGCNPNLMSTEKKYHHPKLTSTEKKQNH